MDMIINNTRSSVKKSFFVVSRVADVNNVDDRDDDRRTMMLGKRKRKRERERERERQRETKRDKGEREERSLLVAMHLVVVVAFRRG